MLDPYAWKKDKKSLSQCDVVRLRKILYAESRGISRFLTASYALAVLGIGKGVMVMVMGQQFAK